ncbi:NACHT and WD repeat domain-containing protein 2-like [Nerophis lumbriciformis]|uniref:NACHT and WD repeat domain-containing protein 2-like n=1 Tax=Nerophis lumbriciformis TaxID=546530 RepID=UPI002AE015F8|nr:NACHT and WD repeat domain-containing protein 2-like [Nerophis lumbriciformis]
MEPLLPSRRVKVYLCSNPADSVLERRVLRDSVFPKLGRRCSDTLGVDVRVIDPFESSHPSQWPDANTRKDLIKECRESSCGPFLLALIGHDYGRPSLPALVEVSRFHMVLQQMQQAGLGTKELERVYHRDENVSPPSFCLRLTPAPQEDDRTDDLARVFEGAVRLCARRQLLTREEVVAFSRSVLDGDLRFALDNCPPDDIIGRCLVYVHKVVNIEEPATAERDLLSDLIDNFLRGLVDSCGLAVYATTTECDRRHGYTAPRRRGYARLLCRQVYADLTASIDGWVSNSGRRVADAPAREGAEQEELCAILSRCYHVARPETEEVRVYVQRRDSRRPLVLTGGPCAGKTVLLAHCAQQIKSWLPDVDPAVITLCTPSLHVPSAAHLLASLCHRILRTYECSSPAHHERTFTSNLDLNLATVSRALRNPDLGFYEATRCLRSLLSVLPSSQRPLVLILDGVDQTGRNVALQLVRSLPSPLAPGVKLILGVSSNQTAVLQAIGRHYPECSAPEGARTESGYLQVALGSADRKQRVEMLMSQLSSSGRSVTSGQLALVSKALTSCCLTLYARLMRAHASLWCSDSDVSESCLPDGVHSSIATLLQHLEHKHTSCSVGRAVAYLTLSRVGLTETELADLLSRVEPCQVTQVDLERLLLDLKGFLIRRTVRGCQVLSWVSRHFGLVVAKTYLCTSEARRQVHSEMADYFGKEWNFASTERKDRNEEEQPSFRVLANARKAVELMHHLRESNTPEIRAKVLISWSFQYVLVQAGQLRELVAMLRQDEEGSRKYLKECTLLANILASSSCFLQSDPQKLPALMDAILLPYLKLFPALRSYFGEMRSGLAVVLPPAPDTVVRLRCLEPDSGSKRLSVTSAAGTQCGTVVEVMVDGSAWVWRDCSVVRLSLNQKTSELKFSGVKSNRGFMLFSTQCNKLFLWDVTTPGRLVEVKVPQPIDILEGFVACGRQFCAWWKGDGVLTLFDASRSTLSDLHCQSCVTCAVFSSSGSYIYCGQEEGAVSIFDVERRSLLCSCSNSNHSAVVSIILCENRQEMACVEKTGGVILWDITGKTQSPRLVKESSAGVESNAILNTDYSDAFSSLLLCDSRHVTVWNTCEWETCDQFLAPQDREFTQAVFSQDGHLFLALLDACPQVLAWRLSTGLCVLSLDANEPPHTLLKTASDIVCVTGDGRLFAWDSGMVRVAGAAPKMGSGVEEVVVEQSGRWFYTSDRSDSVWRWNLETGLPHSKFLHESPVEKVRLSRDDVTLVTLSGEEIYIWRAETGQNVHRICGSRATDILIAPNSNFGVSLSEQGLSRVWKLAHGSVVCAIHLYLFDAQVSPESTFLIGRHGGDLLAASLWSGMISKCFSSAGSWEDVVAFCTLSRNPDYVVVMVASGVLYTWKISDETACQHFQLPGTFYCQPQHFQMTSDGSFALLSADNAAITLLDVTRVRLCSFRTEGSVIKARLDETGCYVAYVSRPTCQENACSLHASPILTVVRLSDGEKVGRVLLCKDPLTLLMDGQQLVFVGFQDGSVGVYSISGQMATLARQLKGCCFDSATMTWFPRATPKIIWS